MAAVRAGFLRLYETIRGSFVQWVKASAPPSVVTPPAMPGMWRGFSDEWGQGRGEIYAIRLVRGGLPASESVAKHKRNLFQWFRLSYGPPVITLVILAGSHHWPSPDRLALLCTIGTVNAGAFAAAGLAWGYPLKRSGTIDDVLRPCRERDYVVSIIRRAVRHDRQSILPLIAASLPWIVAGAHGDFMLRNWAPLTLLLLNISWCLAIIGNVSYWILIPPLIVFRMQSCREVRLRWNDPARTEGIRAISEGYLYPAFFLALASIAVSVPGLADRSIFGAYVPFLFGWVIFLSLWVGVFPQVCIYIVVRRFKLRVMDEIAESENIVLTRTRMESNLKQILLERMSSVDRLSIYRILSEAPGLPFGTGTIAQYVAAVVGSVAGFLLQFPHSLG